MAATLTPRDIFNDNINNILNKLQIEDTAKGKLMAEFNAIFATASPAKKIELINDVDTHVKTLLDADDVIINIQTNPEFSKIITTPNWKEMKENMGKLQGLVLLRAVSTKDCDTVMKTLTDAVSGKLKAVNQVLEANIKQAGGGNKMNEISMYNKYLKYKAKYLSLKK